MWPLGHGAVGYLLYSLSAERDRVPQLRPSVLLALVLGSQFPDLVDKPLAWELGVLPAGRSLAHSLFLLIPLVALTVTLTRRYERPALGIAFAVGAIAHSFVDAIPALWLGSEHAAFLVWPLVAVVPPEGSIDVVEMFRNALTQPWFLFEFVLAAWAAVRWRGDHFPGLGWFLSGHEQEQSTTRS